MPGRVLSIDVNLGDTVTTVQQVMVLEAMKMENSIESPVSGRVKRIFVEAGQSLQQDDKIMEIEK